MSLLPRRVNKHLYDLIEDDLPDMLDQPPRYLRPVLGHIKATKSGYWQIRILGFPVDGKKYLSKGSALRAAQRDYDAMSA